MLKKYDLIPSVSCFACSTCLQVQVIEKSLPKKGYYFFFWAVPPVCPLTGCFTFGQPVFPSTEHGWQARFRPQVESRRLDTWTFVPVRGQEGSRGHSKRVIFSKFEKGTIFKGMLTKDGAALRGQQQGKRVYHPGLKGMRGRNDCQSPEKEAIGV